MPSTGEASGRRLQRHTEALGECLAGAGVTIQELEDPRGPGECLSGGDRLGHVDGIDQVDGAIHHHRVRAAAHHSAHHHTWCRARRDSDPPAGSYPNGSGHSGRDDTPAATRARDADTARGATTTRAGGSTRPAETTRGLQCGERPMWSLGRPHLDVHRSRARGVGRRGRGNWPGVGWARGRASARAGVTPAGRYAGRALRGPGVTRSG